MNRTSKRWLILGIGWGFVLLGIAGFVVPVLPGLLFLAIGLIVLSGEYFWARNLLAKLTARFPSLATHVNYATEKAQAWVGRTRVD
ncbi:MAG: PGPGW domain-containing protein [Candidatus Korobacteraceae bacterium]